MLRRRRGIPPAVEVRQREPAGTAALRRPGLRLPHRAATVAARVDIQYTTLALTDLRLLPPRFADQIIRKIERLRVGLVGDVKALTNAEAGYRLRSGDFRVLFDSDGKTVVIRRVLNRRDAYR